MEQEKFKNSVHKNQSSVFLTLNDYNDLATRANRNDEEIKITAEKITAERTELNIKKAYIHVQFDKYPNRGTIPYTIVNVELPFVNDDDVTVALSEIQKSIYKWAEENLKDYTKEMMELSSTKKDCKNYIHKLEKNKEEIHKLKFMNLILSGVSLILFATVAKPLICKLLELF